jgi:hypothetical protein
MPLEVIHPLRRFALCRFVGRGFCRDKGLNVAGVRLTPGLQRGIIEFSRRLCTLARGALHRADHAQVAAATAQIAIQCPLDVFVVRMRILV